jgi:CRISPR-associated protein Cas2
MCNFGDHLQYSIFECRLTEMDLARCRSQLSEIIHHQEDQILFVNLGSAEGHGDRVIQPWASLMDRWIRRALWCDTGP